MLRFPVPPTTAVEFSPDGRLLAAGDGPAVRLYDSFTGRVERVLSRTDPADYRGPAHDLVFAPDGLRLAVRYEYSATQVWSVSAGRRLGELSRTAVPPAFLPCGRRVVTVGGLSDPDQFRPHNCRLWFWAAPSTDLLEPRLDLARGPITFPVAVAAPAGGRWRWCRPTRCGGSTRTPSPNSTLPRCRPD
jgi:WD40 repeat protein